MQYSHISYHLLCIQPLLTETVHDLFFVRYPQNINDLLKTQSLLYQKCNHTNNLYLSLQVSKKTIVRLGSI